MKAKEIINQLLPARKIRITHYALLVTYAVFFFTLTCYSLSLDDAYQDYLYGDYQKAIIGARQLRESSEVLYFLGLNFIKTGDYPKARNYLRKLLSKYPKSRVYEQGLVKLSDTYFLEGNFSRAKVLYEEIKEKYPKINYLPLIYLRLAQIASKEGLWQEKNKYLKAIEEGYPESCEMKFAGILNDLGDFFAIQVGAFIEKSNALILKKELADKNYSAYILEDREGDFVFYKVRIGKFTERKEVQELYLKLLSQGYPARIYP